MSAPTLASPESQERAQRFFRPELDVLRFFAFCLVFLTHIIPNKNYKLKLLSDFREGTGFGVQVFFVLSAYLITELLLRERDASGSINIRSFYIRRILRIWPLYFAVLLIGFAASRLIPGQDAISVPELLTYIFLVGNWYAAFHGGIGLGLGINVIWSVNVEEQFYLLLPLAVRAASRKRILILCVVVWALSQLAVAVMCLNGFSQWTLWVATITNMQYFSIGAAISVLLKGRVPGFNLVTRTGLVVAGMALFTYLHKSDVARYTPFLAAGLGSAFIFFGFLGARIPKGLNGLRYLGKISYGLYMLHSVSLVQINVLVPRYFHVQHNLYILKVLSLTVTIGVAHLSYTYLEKPFLRLKEHFEVVRSRAA